MRHKWTVADGKHAGPWQSEVCATGLTERRGEMEAGRQRERQAWGKAGHSKSMKKQRQRHKGLGQGRTKMKMYRQQMLAYF